jgi:CBS domain-containing protein
MKVKFVMKHPVSAVHVDASLEEARALMERSALRHLPVTDGTTLAGLVSERALRRVEPSTLVSLGTWELAPDPDRLRVRDVMSTPLLSVGPDTEVAEAASILAANGADALAVVEGHDIVGMVRVRDVLGVVGHDLGRPRRARLGRIVAAVDDEPRSRALVTAAALARHHDARLTLVRVLSPLPRRGMPDVWPELWGPIDRERMRAARLWLSSQAAEAAPGLAVDVVVAEGDRTAGVVALAEQRESDLIVVDAPAAAPLTVTAPCPVLGVPLTGRACHARG